MTPLWEDVLLAEVADCLAVATTRLQLLGAMGWDEGVQVIVYLLAATDAQEPSAEVLATKLIGQNQVADSPLSTGVITSKIPRNNGVQIWNPPKPVHEELIQSAAETPTQRTAQAALLSAGAPFVQQTSNMYQPAAGSTITPTVANMYDCAFANMNGVLWTGFGGSWNFASVAQVARSWDLGKTWRWEAPTLVGSSGGWPYSITGSAVAFYQNMLVMAGGSTPTTIGLQSVWTSVDGVNWAAAPNGNFGARDYATLVAVSQPSPRLYLITGQNSVVSSSRYTTSWWTSDPSVANSWVLAPAVLPTRGPMFVPSAATATNTGRLAVWTDRLYISNIGVSSWTFVPSVPTFPNRVGPSLVNSRGNLYVVGGCTTYYSSSTFMADVWVSPDEGNSWLLVAEYGSEPRCKAITIASGNAVIQGIGRNAQPDGIAKSVWIGWF